MGKKILKWTGLTIGGLLLIVILFYVFVHFSTEARINKTYSVAPQRLAVPDDEAAYRRGQHIANIRGCMGCHGSNLAGGRAFLDEKSPLGVLYASNLTSGVGGVQYTDQDWIRTLRHGLNRQNKSVWFMPSHEVYHISNQEMADLICYLKKQPPVNQTVPQKEIKPLGRVLTFFNQFPLLPAEMIDHKANYKDQVQTGATAEYGSYLATTCKGCHGPNLKGAPAHGEGEPAIPDISTTGHLGKWKASDFITALRTGNTPEGKHLADAMPWKELSYTEEELKAIYLYLHQLK